MNIDLLVLYAQMEQREEIESAVVMCETTDLWTNRPDQQMSLKAVARCVATYLKHIGVTSRFHRPIKRPLRLSRFTWINW